MKIVRYPGHMYRKLVFAALLTTIFACAEAPAGRWDATIRIGALKVPFKMEFEGNGTAFAGSLVHGDVRIRSTSGSFDGKTARLEFERSAHLEATLVEKALKGTFGSDKGAMHPFEATEFCTCGFAGEVGPDIMGAWDIPEAGWRLAIRRVGEDTLATLSRGRDDFGPLSGRFDGMSFALSFFDGTQAAVLELEPRKDGGLAALWKEPGAAEKKLQAVRSGP